MRRGKLDFTFLSGLFKYDPDTGAIMWRNRPDKSVQWNGRFAGKLAGAFDDRGYLKIGVGYGTVNGHRIAWILGTGSDADGDVDHINGDKRDNRLVNLRVATRSENMRNRPRTRASRSGLKGVSWHRAAGCWTASITLDYERHYLGLFNTKEAAHAAYAAAAERLHGEFARAA